MKTRRHGYYKVPSLKVFGTFGHKGRWATLEDWFDPQRKRDDYFPTGFKSYSAKRNVLKGHPFESFERRHFPKASPVLGFRLTGNPELGHRHPN
jgi:hypothetical protein